MTYRECNSRQFRCRDGSGCIYKHRWCDETWDCSDGSDEDGCRYCGEHSTRCNADWRLCYSIYESCDGVNNCPDGSDEQPGCEPYPEYPRLDIGISSSSTLVYVIIPVAIIIVVFVFGILCVIILRRGLLGRSRNCEQQTMIFAGYQPPQNTGYHPPNTGYHPPNTGHRPSNTAHYHPNTGIHHHHQNTCCHHPNTGHPLQNSCYHPPNSGHHLTLIDAEQNFQPGHPERNASAASPELEHAALDRPPSYGEAVSGAYPVTTSGQLSAGAQTDR